MWWLLVLGALPTQVDFKSETATFSAAHEVALDEGRLWWRARGTQAWSLLPPDGLPAPRGRLEALKELVADLPLAPAAFVRPNRLVRLAADGDNLLAVGDNGVGYYTKLSTLEWVDVWGPTGLKAPLRIDEGVLVFAMSHRKIPYEDLDGNPHPVTAGVTTVYALLEQGRRLAYADPWLPSGWNRFLCLPERNTFVAASLSASASTMFVMDASGRSFTRLADFDTVGDDPALPYSWTRARRRGAAAVIRTLPGEDWKAQPKIPGPHSTLITITQTGARNADRELRVEGDKGTWKKQLTETAWRFERTGTPMQGALTKGAAPSQPSREATWVSDAEVMGAKVSLEGFDPDCSPATLVLQSAKSTVRIPLHFHGGLEFERAERDLRGALLLPRSGDRTLQALRVVAGGSDVLEVELDVTNTSLVLKHVPGLEWRFSKK